MRNCEIKKNSIIKIYIKKYKNIKAGNLCNNIICQNGGKCTAILKGPVPTGECWCSRGFSGFYCEIKSVPGK